MTPTERRLAARADNTKRGFENTANGCIRSIKWKYVPYPFGRYTRMVPLLFMMDFRYDLDVVLRDMEDAVRMCGCMELPNANLGQIILTRFAPRQQPKSMMRHLKNGMTVYIQDVSPDFLSTRESLMGNIDPRITNYYHVLYSAWEVLFHAPLNLDGAMRTAAMGFCSKDALRDCGTPEEPILIPELATMFAANLQNLKYQFKKEKTLPC